MTYRIEIKPAAAKQINKSESYHKMYESELAGAKINELALNPRLEGNWLAPSLMSRVHNIKMNAR